MAGTNNRRRKEKKLTKARDVYLKTIRVSLHNPGLKGKDFKREKGVCTSRFSCDHSRAKAIWKGRDPEDSSIVEQDLACEILLEKDLETGIEHLGSSHELELQNSDPSRDGNNRGGILTYKYETSQLLARRD
ncbi:uncharacterized protein RAG0_13029 [Rhynchosporium agropyri]|uniref:Uncharacterized protein n=1 Tax=Rhynchosporium agropyri TaxID=914238 RepID=A0A1E1LAW2_9HELO|nr:uncharacterized protein RAG0_13029 [Rhynchosporium agropyri]